jgi:prepilin-type N-terminal cleavage/methylation domain-containing protein
MLKELFRNKKGQSLIEILVAITIAAILIGGAVGAIAFTLRSSVQNKNLQTANSLNQELLDRVVNFAEANWHNIYSPPIVKGSPYHLLVSGAGFSLNSGSESVTLEGITFSRSFVVENVSRDSSGNIEMVYNSINDDPSTQKITVTTNWPQGTQTAATTLNKYLTRSKSLVFHQTDWSGGAGQPGLWVNQTKYDTGSGVTVTNPVGSVKKAP